MTTPTDDCCGLAGGSMACAPRQPAAAEGCPACSGRLRPVSAAHVMRHVRHPAGRGIEAVEPFGFCAAADCPAVFIGGGLRFDAADLRRPPASKTGNGADLLCYCFDVSGAEALAPGADETVAFIRERVRAGDCACDVLNPSAGCCLGAIGAWQKLHAR